MSSGQVSGPIGKGVDWMIRRSVRKNFHSVWWQPPAAALQGPCIFAPNHHGWFDGYLMYHAVTRLNMPTLDWIAEYDAFPLFRYCGGMPFPPDQPLVRASTIRKTINSMQSEKKNLLLFAEGILHRPPEVLKFGKSLDLVCKKVPSATIIPVAIRYEMSMHERPEAFLVFGEPLLAKDVDSKTVRLRVKSLMDKTAVEVSFEREKFELLAAGTSDVNERWDMRRAPRAKK